MKQKWLQFFILTICSFLITWDFQVKAQSQSTCPNSNFNLGNFTDWVGYYGFFHNPAAAQGIIAGRQTIITAPGSYDVNTEGGLFTIPPGETHSARLGNANTGAEAEQLRYSILVAEETNLFIYKYAVVLEDPEHPDPEQPSFTIEVMDNSGELIDPVCGYYYVSAQKGLPTWHTCAGGQVIWKDWTTVGINLSSYIGQTITIIFTTRDCFQTGHFGYAYISAYCSNLEIVYGYCPKDTIAYVTAPPGFSYKWGNGDTTQTTVVNHPVFGMIDSCVLTSVNGCEVKIFGSFKPTTVKADFSSQPVCSGATSSFTDQSTINQNQISDWKWDFGDNTGPVSNIQNPTHFYDSVGMYNTTLIVYSTDGCPDTISKSFEVVPVPVADFKTEYTCNVISLEDTLFFDKQVQLSVPVNNDRFAWSTGDTTNLIQVSTEGWYTVSIENAGLCRTTDSVMMLECSVNLFMPNAFSPNNDGYNDYFRPVTQPEKVRAFNMLIYDRWGEEIYETTDIFWGWDGTIDGHSAPLDNYVYVLSYMHPSGKVNKRKGLFTLIR